ncbi:KUP/HAK/KT family potassium transporter [Rufibacter glacialis]|uniref:Probable potassium transport system protein Kup n=1 Tax=Rufibacter glacialis TaxID=1259555 RepID=A0A5M8QEQ6_9BACT|nr:KUP/HAK/KT family potassium transporter [Rufibacter glacialis]KAA6434527.1 KUP/HAK/KT family potassium transporter [Rufibacter glacialis]GGK70373.1 putative potassium transport system protein kup [Rufibacter glacialis]
MNNTNHAQRISGAGLLIALGIIYGDIGTSPLYVMKAVIGSTPINATLVYGGISCVVWTLTLQTTIKYVVLTLQADNKGEGGIFSLYALVRRKASWLTIPAMVGGSALLADGIITPPISVSSAVEGLHILNPDIPTVPIVIGILVLLFLLQSFGTQIVGKTFGPVMFLWFSMLAILGINSVLQHPEILKSLNPYYAYDLLANYPGGFWLLGAVFLCTTGAEALYSDLGHCGKGNIRISWAFVKSCLLLNYFGQGAWLMQFEGQRLGTLSTNNPFYGLMPDWFLLIGIIIATIAAVIASQALITGSFTLIGEAIRLNMWPKVRLIYPTNVKGQLYVPSINLLLLMGCVGVVLYFRESANMEAAYGLAITVTMLMTTTLLSYYLITRRVAKVWVGLFLAVYLAIEGSFLIANLIKFPHGGWVTLVIGFLLISIMYIWLKAFYIKRRLTEYVPLPEYVPALRELSEDDSIPKYTTHLVFMTSADRTTDIESKIIYSIFQKRPKRADIYWFIHVNTLDEPYTMDYKVKVLANQDVVRIDFNLGFRVEQRINLFFRKVVEDLVQNKEVDITSRYSSLNKQNLIGDFRFVVLEKFLSYENDLPFWENTIMQSYFYIKQFTPSEGKWFGLDTSSVKIEKVPLIIKPAREVELKRVR